MVIVTKVEKMGQAQTAKSGQSDKRKTRLSPELDEFLHMMKALEMELGSEPKQR